MRSILFSSTYLLLVAFVAGEPTTLEICTICGEEMLRAAKIDLFLNGSISEPTSREVNNIQFCFRLK